MKNRKEMLIYVLYMLAILCFFEIPYLVSFSEHAKMFNSIYNMSSIIFFFIFFMFNVKKKRFSKFLIYLFVFIIYCFFITFIHSGFSNISFFIRILGFCTICDYGLRNNTKIFLKSFETIFLLLLIINIATILLFPEGLYINPVNLTNQNWLLGYKNSHILFILPTIFVSIINSLRNNNKIKINCWLIILLSFFNIVLVDSGTSLVGLFILILMILLSKIVSKFKFFSARNYLIIFYVLVFLIVVLRFQNYFDYIIVDVLNRDLTFTGRTYIWDYALESIKSNMLFGYGEKSFIYFLRTGTVVKSTHDELLQIFYNYGIIGFTLFSTLLFIAVNKLSKNKNKKIAYVISTFLLVWFIMMITESYELQYFIYFLVFSFDIDYLETDSNNLGAINT